MMRFVFLLLILLMACTSETAEKNSNPINEELSRIFTYNDMTTVGISPGTNPGKFDVDVIYPDETFDTSLGTTPLTNRFATTLNLIVNQKLPVDNVRIIVKDDTTDGRLIGTFEISMEEIQKLLETYEPLQKTIKPYLKLDEKFQVEVSLFGQSGSAKNVNVNQVVNKTTGDTTIKIDFDLEKKKIKNEWEIDPLDDISAFENLVATLVRIGFEADDEIDRVEIRADLTEIDPRWNDSTLIARYSLDRDGFTEIDENWDNLQYKIFDKIEYEPLFLADFASESKVLSVDFGSHTKITLYDDDDFESIDKTLGAVEHDSASLIKNFFDQYKDVDEIEIITKAKIPAEEGMISSDGIHQIIHEFMIVDADRSIHENLDYDKLSDQQVLFNFDARYHDKASELAIRSNLFSKSGFYRSIQVDDDSAVIDIDACLFVNDKDMSTKIKEARILANKGEDASVEDTVADIMTESAKKLFYDIHPPYLEEATFDLTVVYRDTTGNEIDTRDLGSIIVLKDEDANYWFQTEDPGELDWVMIDADTINIDNDEFFCQS